MIEDPNGWRRMAACSPATADLFETNGFGGVKGMNPRRREAIKICSRCPVVARCWLDARDHPSETTWRIAGGAVWAPVRPR